MAPLGSEDGVEAEIAVALATGSDADWRALWDATDALAEETTFATWAGGDVVETITVEGEERAACEVGYPVYRESVEQVRDRLRSLGLIVPFDWTNWEGVSRYQENPAALADAPVGDAVRLLTAIQRAERFGDGSIEGALESGLMKAALARMRTWYDAERPAASESGSGERRAASKG